MQTDAMFLGDRAANKEVSATGASLKDWKPDSWKSREALQQPNYVDQAELEVALSEIANRPPLVFAGEVRGLQAQLANAAEEGDQDAFSAALAEYDGMSRLDPWKTKLLLRAKKKIQSRVEEEDDLT